MMTLNVLKKDSPRKWWYDQDKYQNECKRGKHQCDYVIKFGAASIVIVSSIRYTFAKGNHRMKRSKHEIIIDALGGNSVTDLVENWTFTLKEIAPYVFNAEGRDENVHTSLGAAGTAEEALESFLIRANKIILRENRKIEFKENIRKLFGNRR